MTAAEIEKIFRDEAGRALATLIRLVGDFDLAEDALQDAFAVALERWPVAGPPSNPRAWLVNTGRNKAIDRIRRQIRFRGKQGELTHELLHNASASAEPGEATALDDDMLRLIFICCHPAFAVEVQVALTLRTVCGLTTAQVARAFLASEEAMAQRLLRAKQKIRLAGIPYEVPEREAFAPRLRGVLAVIYLMFTEGYAATSGEGLMRPDMAREAIRLGAPARRPDARTRRDQGIAGADAAARRAPRRTRDRGRRHRAAGGTRPRAVGRGQIAEGLKLVEETCGCRAGRKPTRCRPRSPPCMRARRIIDDTDWPQIAGLYEVLLRISPSPVIELNHAAAVSMVDGPARALDLVDALQARGGLDGYALLPAVRADLLRRLGRRDAAREAYLAATAATQLEPLRRLYARRMAELDGG